jgi:hypothetical protein
VKCLGLCLPPESQTLNLVAEQTATGSDVIIFLNAKHSTRRCSRRLEVCDDSDNTSVFTSYQSSTLTACPRDHDLRQPIP